MSTERPLTDRDRELRYALVRELAASGKAPAPPWLAERLGATTGEVETGLRRLEAHHLLTLAPASIQVWMVHPFSAVPTPFPVTTSRARYWANCAWDALSLPPLLGLDGEIETRCGESGEPMRLAVRDGEVEGSGVVHFLVPPARFWDNVGFT